MAKKLYWECPRCGAGYEAYEGKKPLEDGICEDCGGELVKTPYTFHEMLYDMSNEVLHDIMENYIKPNPQYDPEVYEMWRKRRDGTQSTFDRKKQQEKNQPKCPKCGSTAITAGQRGYSILTGFLGSSQTVNRCANCGYKWKPRG